MSLNNESNFFKASSIILFKIILLIFKKISFLNKNKNKNKHKNNYKNISALMVGEMNHATKLMNFQLIKGYIQNQDQTNETNIKTAWKDIVNVQKLGTSLP